MSVLSYIPPDANGIFFNEAFRAVLETYLPKLRMSRDTSVSKVAPIDTITFRFDLDGYLISKHIPSFMHWIIARINGMKSAQDFGPGVEYLLYPAQEELEQIRQIYMSTLR